MRRVGAVALVFGIVAGPALAQEQAGSRPLSLTVRPSGTDPEPSEAIARQERLLKRMAQNEFLFRSICIRCGDAWKHNSYAPFNPMRSLRGMPQEPSAEAQQDPGLQPSPDAATP